VREECGVCRGRGPGWKINLSRSAGGFGKTVKVGGDGHSESPRPCVSAGRS